MGSHMGPLVVSHEVSKEVSQGVCDMRPGGPQSYGADGVSHETRGSHSGQLWTGWAGHGADGSHMRPGGHMRQGDSSGQAGQVMGLMGSHMRPGGLILDSSGQLSSLQVGQVMGLMVTTGHEQAHMKAQTHMQACT
jgi:hypothetical protein